MAFEITVAVTGPVAEMTLSGDLDESSAPRFRQMLEELAASEVVKPTLLVLHMRDLDFLASGGIRVLLITTQRHRWRATIYVVAPQEQVLDTLRRTGLIDSVVILDEYPATTA